MAVATATCSEEGWTGASVASDLAACCVGRLGRGVGLETALVSSGSVFTTADTAGARLGSILGGESNMLDMNIYMVCAGAQRSKERKG